MFFSIPTSLRWSRPTRSCGPHVEQQRSRPAGKVEHGIQPSSACRSGAPAVERDDAGKDARYLLRRVRLRPPSSRPVRKLPDQVLVGIPQRVDIGRESAIPRAISLMIERSLALRSVVLTPQLVRSRVDLLEQPWKLRRRLFLNDLNPVGIVSQQFSRSAFGEVDDAFPRGNRA